MENLTLVAPILTRTDAENIDHIIGGTYLQDMFKAQGPFIGSTDAGWMPIVNKAGPDGIAYYRAEPGYEIFETAQKLVAAYNAPKPEPFAGNVLEAEYVSRYGANITFVNTRIEMGNWTKKGLDDLMLDLVIIRDTLSGPE